MHFFRATFTFCIIFFGVFLVSFESNAQDENLDSLINYYLSYDSLVLDQMQKQMDDDSLSIFDLIDSLLNYDLDYSQLSFRLGYTSDITNAGRNFGIEQYGLNAGLTYYHRSGLFADLSGYWNSDIEPNYNPTIVSVGYMSTLSTKSHISLTYDHYFYHEQDTGSQETFSDMPIYPLTNSISASGYLDIKSFTIGVDYSFLFGQKNAHRIRGNLMYNWSKNHWGFIDRFVLMPTASILLGNDDIYYLSASNQYSTTALNKLLIQKMIELYGYHQVAMLWKTDRKQFNTLKQSVYNQYYDEFVNYTLESKNSFGIMNYSFSLPVYIYIGHFLFALSYNYNIPVPLPGENIDVSPNSYISASLFYNIPFRRKQQ